MSGRALCLRCLRPGAVCYCPHLTPIPSATHVVFLQHPRESRVAIGTCRMAHLALPGSELYRGVSFEAHPRVRVLAAAADGDVAVLYPGDGACAPETLGAGRPRTLIVLDGTWRQARTMWRENPALHRLPRIGVVRATPGNYRIRREPAPHCLATIEAIVEALGRLDGDPQRFLPILRAFDAMVETQLVYRRLKPNPPWRRTKRQRRPRVSAARAAVRERWSDLVVMYAEANAGVEPPELLQLVGCRVATGERFEAIVAPAGALAPSTSHHLEIPAERLLVGEPVQTAMARWEAFLRPDDVLCAWGYYTSTLLRAAGGATRAMIDLRAGVTHELGRRTGGIEQAAALLGDDAATPWTAGRAGRRVAGLEDIVVRLREEPGAAQAAARDVARRSTSP